MSVKFKMIKENILGFEFIDVLQFNYDNQGTALAYARSENDEYTLTIAEPELSETLLNDEFYKIQYESDSTVRRKTDNYFS